MRALELLKITLLALLLAAVTQAALAQVAQEALLSHSRNLALAENGGRVAFVPSAQAGAARLIDGNPEDGWKAEDRFDRKNPPAIVIALGRKAEVHRVLLSPRHFEPAGGIAASTNN